jgi:hypothetical protein
LAPKVRKEFKGLLELPAQQVRQELPDRLD